MRLLHLFFFFLIFNLSTAQNYFGYLSDNYSGLHSATLNPANLADSKFVTDINIVSLNGSFNNDYFDLDISNIFKGFDEIENTNTNALENNNFAFSFDVMGPSFMFNLSPKHSIGLITKARMHFNVNEIKGTLFDEFESDFNTGDFNVNEDEFTATLNSWLEIGLVYASTIINAENHYLKGGFTVKHLRGAGNAYTKGKNLSVNFDADGFAPNNGSIATTGEIEYGSSNGLNQGGDFEFEKNAYGFGADLGLVYEWRGKEANLEDQSKTSYKLKLGVSVTDIGSINYKEADASSYNITNIVDETSFEAQDNLEDKLNNLYTKTGSKDFTKANLPTAFHFTADYNLNSKLFLNLRTDLSLRKANQVNTSKIDNTVILTPRFERKWFSAYMPLSVMEYSGFNAGFGFRAGPLFVGSNTILTNLLSSKSNAASIYAGVKIPIYKKGKSN